MPKFQQNVEVPKEEEQQFGAIPISQHAWQWQVRRVHQKFKLQFLTNYVIPKSLKVGHCLSQLRCILHMHTYHIYVLNIHIHTKHPDNTPVVRRNKSHYPGSQVVLSPSSLCHPLRPAGWTKFLWGGFGICWRDARHTNRPAACVHIYRKHLYTNMYIYVGILLNTSLICHFKYSCMCAYKSVGTLVGRYVAGR